MNRRTFTTTALLGLAVAAVPQVGLAQSNPWLGMWKLNLAKSTYPPGQAPRSSVYNFQVTGANLTNTVETVDAAGSSTKTVNPHVYDGQVHPRAVQRYLLQAHGKEGFEAAERGSVTVLGDCVGLIEPQDIVSEAAHSCEDTGVFSDA